MSNLEFYRERAEQSRVEAEACDLNNAKERHLRSAAVWEAMAQRAEGTDQRRQAREAPAQAA